MLHVMNSVEWDSLPCLTENEPWWLLVWSATPEAKNVETGDDRWGWTSLRVPQYADCTNLTSVFHYLMERGGPALFPVLSPRKKWCPVHPGLQTLNPCFQNVETGFASPHTLNYFRSLLFLMSWDKDSQCPFTMCFQFAKSATVTVWGAFSTESGKTRDFLSPNPACNQINFRMKRPVDRASGKETDSWQDSWAAHYFKRFISHVVGST